MEEFPCQKRTRKVGKAQGSFISCQDPGGTVHNETAVYLPPFPLSFRVEVAAGVTG
jgi:hypothetical protein